MSDSSQHSVSFVRTESIPEREPPYAASGPVKWMRENLFATPANSILTIVAAYFILLTNMATVFICLIAIVPFSVVTKK